MTALILLLLSLPCVYSESAQRDAIAAKYVCVPAGRDVASRETLPSPGITARAGLASPTRSPWIVANGWRFMRRPGAKYVYDVPAAKAALAAAEAFAYRADAVLKIQDLGDLRGLGGVGGLGGDLRGLAEMLGFLEQLPAADLPPVADLAVVDDGSAITGEVMNLLARRNLLFQVVQAPSPRFRINIAVGSREYPREEAADPSAFALKIRRQLTDEQRSLRVYGSEVVIARLDGAAGRLRLHLLNYGGRNLEGLRVRLRGAYRGDDAYVSGAGRLKLEDLVVADGATEFSVPRLTTYAVIDLQAVH